MTCETRQQDLPGPYAAHPAPEPVDANRCRSFFRTLTAGVSLITVAGPSGPLGMTASSVIAVSLDPPLLLVSLTNSSRTLAAVCATRQFAVNLLTAEQEHLAVRFASGRPGWAKFHDLQLVGERPPVLTSSLSTAVCRVSQTVEAGDHTLVIAAVEATTAGAGNPLVWHASGFSQLAGQTAAVSLTPG